ncbi:MAG: Mbeg1-like protein [Bacilli bacterium]
MNIFDYLLWRKDLSFSQSEINEVDALIFSVISYIEYDGIIPTYPSKRKIQYAKCVEELFSNTPKKEINLGLLLSNNILDVADICKDSNRFGKVYVSNYINKISSENEEQFCAITYHFLDTIYICFRGTDDTIIGWQENLNMICEKTIPAQTDAVKYLNKVSSLFPDKKIIIGGHSKGGNLSFYASIYCEKVVQDKIIKVYSFDGPGFFKKRLDKDKYLRIKKRLISYLPQDSIVGQFFDLISKKYVIKSNARGVNQHEALSWQIEGNHFVKVKSLTRKSVEIDKGITKLISSLSLEERQELSSEVWNVFSNLELDKLLQIKGNYRQLIRSTSSINKKYRRFIISAILVFIKNGAI